MGSVAHVDHRVVEAKLPRHLSKRLNRAICELYGFAGQPSIPNQIQNSAPFIAMHLRLADEAPTPLLALAALELTLLLLALRFPKSLPEVGFVMVTLLALSYVKKDLWRQLFSETTASGTAPLERASLDSRRLAHRNAQSLFLEMLLLLAVNVAASFVKFAPGIAEACSVALIADAVRSLVLQPSATPQDCSKLFAARGPGAGRGIRLCQASGLGHDNSSTLLLSKSACTVMGCLPTARWPPLRALPHRAEHDCSQASINQSIFCPIAGCKAAEEKCDPPREEVVRVEPSKPSHATR